MSRSPSRSMSPRAASKGRSHSRSLSRSRSARRDENTRGGDERPRDDERRTDDRRSRRDDRGESNSVLVRHLNFKTSPEELKRVFSEFGEVSDVYLPLDYHSKRPRGFGFIQFTNGEDAKAACRQVDGTEVDGAKVEVVIAQQNRKSPNSMRRFTNRGDDRSGGRRYDNDRDRDHGRSRGFGYREERRRSRSRSGGRRDYGDRSREYGRSSKY